MGTTRLLLLSALICFTTEAPSPKAGLVLLRNRRNVKSRAELRSCTRHNCSNSACSHEDGWQIYGSDWGCCGNYDGCCTWASVVCYAHDVLCQCCDYGWWCGPDCRREPECYRPGRKFPNQHGGVDHSVVNQIPDRMPHNGYPGNTNGSERNNTGHRNTIPNERFTNIINRGHNARTGKGSTIENKGVNVTENNEQLARNESENGFYVQNVTQELNYSKFPNDESDQSSVNKTTETGYISDEGSDNYTGNVTQDAINITTINTDQHEITNVSRSQLHKLMISGKIANYSSGILHNNSSETTEHVEEAYDMPNRTHMTNISGLDGDYNSTVTDSPAAEDNSINGENKPEVGGTDRTGGIDSEEVFPNVIHVAKMSSSSADPDPGQDSIEEEDGSGVI